MPTLSKPTLKIILIGFILFIINLISIANFEMSYDESYYWIYSEFLDFGYFDHPPMVGLLIKIGTLIFGQNELGVRVMFNILSVSSLFLMWDLTEKKNPVIVSVLFLTFPLLNLGGLLALPDTPLLFFAALFFWQLKRYLKNDSLKNVIFLSLVISLLFYSKYHGILIILLSVLALPGLLRKKTFWYVAALTVLFFLPHMYWQYKHDFVSFKFHLTGRVEKHFSLHNILDYLGGQIALAGIFNFFLFVYLIFKIKVKDQFERILIFNTFGFYLFLFFMSFRNQIEANWTVTCAFALGVLFSDRIVLMKKQKLFVALSVLPIAISCLFRGVMLNTETFITMFEKDFKESRLNEIAFWKTRRIGEINDVCGQTKIVGDNYQISSKLAFYNQAIFPALHFGSRNSHYSILNLEKNIGENEEICYLTSKNLEGSVRIETNFKDPVFILPKTSLKKLGERYGMKYEEIIRARF